MKLSIELVPKTSWCTNLRSEMSGAQWDRIRRATYKRADYECEICGGTGSNHPVECHETWEYNDETHEQTLTGLVALCPSCHEVKHIGYASTQGNGERAIKHLADVNDWSRQKAVEHAKEAFETWEERSQHQWTVDISLIEEDNFQQQLAQSSNE